MRSASIVEFGLSILHSAMSFEAVSHNNIEGGVLYLAAAVLYYAAGIVRHG